MLFSPIYVPQRALLGVGEVIPENGAITIALGALAAGRYPFSCSMGMYTGTITVTA